MQYIVGLGNPGKTYAHTRHNIGFMIVDVFTEKNGFSSWYKKSSLQGEVVTGCIDAHELTVLKPTTFMNDSGSAVRALVPKGQEASLVVVYDDVDLPLGEFKISFDRGAGGHNGILSLIERLGTSAFVRVRVGVAQTGLFTGKVKRPKGGALATFVLEPFSKREAKKLQEVTMKVVEALETVVREGKEKAMNLYNG